MLSWLNCPLSNKPMVGTPPAQDFAPAVEVSPDFEGDSACHPGGFKGIPWKIWKLYDFLTECMEIEISYSLPIISCILIDLPILYHIDIWSKRGYMYIDIIIIYNLQHVQFSTILYRFSYFLF